MRVSLIIPVFNEIGHLKEFCEMIDKIDLKAEKELVFIDDKSCDGSAQLLREYEFTSRVIRIFQEENGGKGSALKAGIKAATGDIIGIQDADFEYDPQDIPAIMSRFAEGKADVVYGSRFKKDSKQVHRTFHYLVNRILTLLSNFCSGLYLTDMESCYKFFKKDIIQNIRLESNRFGFEPEVTAKISRLKIRIDEVPISYYPRNYMEGKKITWKDGVAAFWHILYFNFFQNNKSRFLEGMDKNIQAKGRILL